MENFKNINKEENVEKKIDSFKEMKKDDIKNIEDYERKRDEKLWEFYDAIINNDIKKIKEFLKEGFSPNEELPFPSENTVFFDSLPYISPEAVEILYNHGAELVDYTSEGEVFYTALEELISLDRPEIIEKLIDLGADWRVKNNGNSLLYYAAYSASTLKVFLEKTDLDVNEEGRDGSTPLFIAAYHKDREAVKMLLDRGALINKQDKNGYTALHHSVLEKSPLNRDEGLEGVQILIEYGADPNIKSNDGKTPLDIAIENKHYKTAEYLRSIGAKLGKEL